MLKAKRLYRKIKGVRAQIKTATKKIEKAYSKGENFRFYENKVQKLVKNKSKWRKRFHKLKHER